MRAMLTDAIRGASNDIMTNTASDRLVKPLGALFVLIFIVAPGGNQNKIRIEECSGFFKSNLEKHCVAKSFSNRFKKSTVTKRYQVYSKNLKDLCQWPVMKLLFGQT